MNIQTFDRWFIACMRTYSIPVLRVAVGIVFLWFGLLKVLDVSPVKNFVFDVYSFMPDGFFMVLGIWEVIVGLGLITKSFLRVTLALLWLQMAGTFFSLLLAPGMFFQESNPLLLTLEGEFVIKNLVLVAAGLTIGGHEVKPWTKKG